MLFAERLHRNCIGRKIGPLLGGFRFTNNIIAGALQTGLVACVKEWMKLPLLFPIANHGTDIAAV